MECPACHTPNSDGARFCIKCGALLPASAPEEADPLIGSIVGGRFRIVGVLGEGGMGRVYNGEQQMGTSVRKVAVKTLLSQYAKDPQVLARFMRECGTVSELEHPNTIKVYDFGQTPSGELYIAMELLSGVSLETALESGALAPDRVDKILGQICGSLQEAHDKGIVHRDLKPANIYLTVRAGEEDYVKVLDFGIAKRDEKHSKQEQKLTQQGTVLGTPPYMSPEQFKGHELDARSDIYSLGVMAYEMLTGRLPFDADTPWAWATQHMTAQPFPFETVPLGSQVPPKMKAAVMRALSKDKNLRQQTVREFYEEFTTGGVRASVPGQSRPSLGDLAAASAAAVAANRTTGAVSMKTQPGEPAFLVGAPPTSSQPMAGPDGATASSPNLFPAGVTQPPSDAVAGPVHNTGSAAVYAPPPPPAAKKSSLGAILAVAAVLAVGSAVGGVLYVRSRGAHTDSTAASGGSTPASSGLSAGKPVEDAGVAPPPSATTPPPPPPPPPPPSTPTPEQECEQARSLADRDEVKEARIHYALCKGPGKAIAHTALEAAEARERKRCHHHPCPR